MPKIRATTLFLDLEFTNYLVEVFVLGLDHGHDISIEYFANIAVKNVMVVLYVKITLEVFSNADDCIAFSGVEEERSIL